MDPVSQELKTLFQDLYTNKGSADFDLSFTMNGKPFTTHFHTTCESITYEKPNGSKLPPNYIFKVYVVTPDGKLSSSCIDIRDTDVVMDPNSEPAGPISSMIYANTPERGCFSPSLVTNKSNANASKHFTSTDVLQILKTKLMLLLPIQKPIKLSDQAVIQTVAISPYNILHKKPALYEKYGYKSDKLNALRSKLETLPVSKIESAKYANTKKTMKQVLEALVGRVVESSELLIDVLKDVTFENENEFNKQLRITHYESVPPFYSFLLFSNVILEEISTKSGLEEWNIFVLDPTSEAWQASNDKLQFTAVSITKTANKPPNAAEGGRRKKRTHKHRSYRKKLISKKRYRSRKSSNTFSPG
jgi:hypothetical protein